MIKDYYLLIGKPADEMSDKDDLAQVVSSGQSFAPVQDTGCVLG